MAPLFARPQAGKTSVLHVWSTPAAAKAPRACQHLRARQACYQHLEIGLWHLLPQRSWSAMTHRLSRCKAGLDQASTATIRQPQPVVQPAAALLLPWFGSKNRSLFAAQCLVETVIQLYLEGNTFEQLQMNLKLASFYKDARLLPELEEDILTSWLALVYLTLQEIGVQTGTLGSASNMNEASLSSTSDSGVGITYLSTDSSLPRGDMATEGADSDAPLTASGIVAEASRNRYLMGMQGYVRTALKGYFEEGRTLAAVTALQGAILQDKEQAQSPFLLLMQQYTRIILLTLEAVAAMQLPVSKDLLQPTVVTKPSGYSQAWSSVCQVPMVIASSDGPVAQSSSVQADSASLGSSLQDGSSSTGDASSSGTSSNTTSSSSSTDDLCPPRGLAVRLLVAFMGAVLGSPYSLAKFVEAVQVAYSQGCSAPQILAQLEDSEFVQSGGLVPVGISDPGVIQEINKELFSTWLSMTYMSFASLGLYFPGYEKEEGWAWAGCGDALAAVSLDRFVSQALINIAAEESKVQEPSDADVVLPATPSTIHYTALVSDSAASSQSSMTPTASSQQVDATPAESSASDGVSDLAGSSSNYRGGSSSSSGTPSVPQGSGGDALTNILLNRWQQNPEVASMLQQAQMEAPQRYLEAKGTNMAIVKIPDADLASSSSAVLLLSQQMALIRLAYQAAVKGQPL